MNIVDKKFYELMNKLKLMTRDEIYINIKDSYLKLNSDIKLSIESFFNNYNYWYSINSKDNNYEALYQKAITLKEHYNDFIYLYQKLSDYHSKKLLYGILNNWYSFDFITIRECLFNPYRPYFDLDIIPKCQNEIYVDIGSYTGDTVIDYLNTYGIKSYKKIYCYEITDSSFAKLKNNLAKYPNIIYRNVGVCDKIDTRYLDINYESDTANKISDKGDILVNTTTLDDDILDKITLIKMDIEGYEEKALYGAINHIKNDLPKLLISIYHKNEDLYKIPKIIEELNDNYKYYIRCYGNNIYPTEIVLFAIPKE